MFKFKKLFFDFEDCAKFGVEGDACCFVVGQLGIEVGCIAELRYRKSRFGRRFRSFNYYFSTARYIVVEAFRCFFFFRIREWSIVVCAFNVEIDWFADDIACTD